jgi:hypothetical protein
MWSGLEVMLRKRKCELSWHFGKSVMQTSLGVEELLIRIVVALVDEPKK